MKTTYYINKLLYLRYFQILTALSILLSGTLLQASVTHYVAPGSSQALIQLTINNAKTGDIVFLRDGTYFVTGPINLKSGITLRGETRGGTILDASAQSSAVVWHYTTSTPISNLTIYKLKFKNIGFKFHGGSAHQTFTGITINHCIFENIKDGNDTYFIQFNYGNENRVMNSDFHRTTSSYVGRGIYSYRGHNLSILSNYIDGYFSAGINVNGSESTLNPALRPSYIDIAYNEISRTSGSFAEDHGMYCWGAYDLLIMENVVSGWSCTANGGSVKVTNSESVIIDSNTFNDSGILLYTYANRYPAYMKNVDVINNIITLSTYDGTPTMYKGIGYWRNFFGSGCEDSILFSNNVIDEGCIYAIDNAIDVDGWNTNNGGITINEAKALVLKSGIYSSGNVVAQ